MKKRPCAWQGTVINAVVKEILPKVIIWVNDPSVHPNEIGLELREAIEDGCDNDGYDISRNLEKNSGWGSDSELVEILDDVAWIQNQQHKALVAKWVEDENIKPLYKVKDKVLHRGRLIEKDYQAVISAVDTTHAKYTLFIEELGHVMKGMGVQGVIVNFEDVKPLEGKS